MGLKISKVEKNSRTSTMQIQLTYLNKIIKAVLTIIVQQDHVIFQFAKRTFFQDKKRLQHYESLSLDFFLRLQKVNKNSNTNVLRTIEQASLFSECDFENKQKKFWIQKELKKEFDTLFNVLQLKNQKIQLQGLYKIESKLDQSNSKLENSQQDLNYFQRNKSIVKISTQRSKSKSVGLQILQEKETSSVEEEIQRGYLQKKVCYDHSTDSYYKKFQVKERQMISQNRISIKHPRRSITKCSPSPRYSIKIHQNNSVSQAKIFQQSPIQEESSFQQDEKFLQKNQNFSKNFFKLSEILQNKFQETNDNEITDRQAYQVQQVSAFNFSKRKSLPQKNKLKIENNFSYLKNMKISTKNLDTIQTENFYYNDKKNYRQTETQNIISQKNNKKKYSSLQINDLNELIQNEKAEIKEQTHQQDQLSCNEEQSIKDSSIQEENEDKFQQRKTTYKFTTSRVPFKRTNSFAMTKTNKDIKEIVERKMKKIFNKCGLQLQSIQNTTSTFQRLQNSCKKRLTYNSFLKSKQTNLKRRTQLNNCCLHEKRNKKYNKFYQKENKLKSLKDKYF